MRNFDKWLAWGAALSLAAGLSSCTQGARIDGTLQGVSDGEVVVAQLDFNRFNVLDTLQTNASGRYTYNMDVEAGDPEFVYVYHKNRPIASLILQKGEKCKVVSDTNGVCSVTGSPESEKMVEVVRRESAFNAAMEKMMLRLSEVPEDSEEARQIQGEISREYVKYYRSCVLYILENSRSLSSVNVLYQYVGQDFPVFSQMTDAMHFRNVSDSLKLVYPHSRYVKALSEEADRRTNLLELNHRLKDAKDVGYIDLAMPDINGKTVKISDIDAKVIMLYFWGTDPKLNLFTADVIKPLYDQYHSKGFEIYGICIDTDKAKWASVVKNQQQGWINVCDGLGAASPALASYAVDHLPVSFFIVDGMLGDDISIKDEASLRRFLDAKLK